MLLIGPSVLASAPPPAPPAVVAIEIGPVVEVSWLPAQGDIDHYNVYGVTEDGVYELLEESLGVANLVVLAAAVPAGYPAYAVSSVANGGAESSPTMSPTVPCLAVTTSPPGAQPRDCRVVTIVPRDV